MANDLSSEKAELRDDKPRGTLLLSDASLQHSETIQAISEALKLGIAIAQADAGESHTVDHSRVILLFLPREPDRWESLVRVTRERTAKPGAHEKVPVLALVDKCNGHSLTKLLATDIDDLVVLPASIPELVDKVRRLLEQRNGYSLESLKRDLLVKIGMDQVIGKSNAFLKVVERVPLMSRVQSPALITGETGTGKEMVARALHYLGARSGHPFVPLNCGAIPEPLFENELFGHAKGAYTGAHAVCEGLMYQANGGTLFLDEVNSLSLPAQVKLLRFLEDGKYKRLGTSRYLGADVRVISATNVDLKKEVHEGRFRGDLYYRLNVLPIELAPLRQRHGDIPLLAEYFLEKYARTAQRGAMYFCKVAMDKLSTYHWPGNVRELKNTIEKAVVMSRSNIIKSDDIDIPVSETTDVIGTRTYRQEKQIATERFEKEYLSQLMDQNGWNITRTAAQARIPRRSLQRLIRKYDLHR